MACSFVSCLFSWCIYKALGRLVEKSPPMHARCKDMLFADEKDCNLCCIISFNATRTENRVRWENVELFFYFTLQSFTFMFSLAPYSPRYPHWVNLCIVNIWREKKKTGFRSFEAVDSWVIMIPDVSTFRETILPHLLFPTEYLVCELKKKVRGIPSTTTPLHSPTNFGNLPDYTPLSRRGVESRVLQLTSPDTRL